MVVVAAAGSGGFFVYKGVSPWKREWEVVDICVS